MKTKKPRTARPTSPYSHLDAAELAEGTKEFNAEFVGDNSTPLTSADRKMIAQARRAGRPKIGAGAKVISITVERSLLARLDAFASERNFTRAQAVASALKLLLGVTTTPPPKRRAVREPAIVS